MTALSGLCNLSHKKLREVTVSILGQFLSRRCFMLCITMEVEPRIVKQYKMPALWQLQKLLGKGDGGWKKRVFVSLFG